MSLPLVDSEWPAPTPNAHGRAIEHHVTAFARWLCQAGAEARFGLVLCAGAGSRAQLNGLLAAHEIDVVDAPATFPRPLHPRILSHQGDHFNRTLYLVDGFETEDPTPLFDALEAQRSQLNRSATWVALVIESTAALEQLLRRAPNLWSSFMWRCLVLSEGCERQAPHAADTAVLNDVSERGFLAEEIFSAALDGHGPLGYEQFSRILRSGYGSVLSADLGDAERGDLIKRWVDGSLDDGVEISGPNLAEALLRHDRKALTPAQLAACRGALEAEPMVLSLIHETKDDSSPWRELQALRQMGGGETPFEEGLFEQATRLSTDHVPGLSAFAAQSRALAAAAGEEVEACTRAFAEAVDLGAGKGCAPEFIFEVLEQRLQLQTLLSDRNGARKTLDHIEFIAPALQSPFYSARALFARGGFIQPLDPKRARSDFLESQRLFSAFGYPDWSERVVAVLNQ